MPNHVLVRKVDTTGEAIAGDVLPEVDELKARANGIRHAHEVLVAAALEGQDDPAHGIGRPPAVVEQFSSGGIARLHLVLFKGIDQVIEWFAREPCGLNRFGEGDIDRMLRTPLEAVIEPVPPCCERDGCLGRGGRLVGKIVGPACKRVDVGQVLPQPRRHQQRGHGEVLIVGRRHGPTKRLGCRPIKRRRHWHEFPGGRITTGGVQEARLHKTDRTRRRPSPAGQAPGVSIPCLTPPTSHDPFAMKILLASPRGFCAGVNMAIETLETAIRLYGTPIYVFHEIVHNKHVVDRFVREGAVFVDRVEDVPEGAVLLFSAHGVAPEVRRVAADRNLNAIDATCPLVTKVHLEAIKYAKAGYRIMLIGHEGHDEVIGTIGQAPEAFTLVETADEVDHLPFGPSDKLAYLTQTTLSVDDASKIINRLKARFPQIVGPPKDDICYATQNRQEAVRLLSEGADTVLVLGSQNSSNSQRLAELARDSGISAYLIDGADEIDPSWFSGQETVVITAGASAPESVVQDCVRWLRDRYGADVEERTIREEEVYFPLPKELRAAAAAVRLPMA
jgi:4-hydroxy-3-methylbut-2-en-1-yl diphosphate reductase